jgi:threonine/homoserine/homoserine lactone efflux protein
MSPLGFAGEVILVSASGVLSPGPLFFINIIYGSKQGVTGGIKIAFGHTIVEFPLVIALALGLFTFSQVFVNNENMKIISIIGGIAIVVFAFTQIISIAKGKGDKQNAYIAISEKKGPILLGVIFSALNPFFLIWWFTVGLKLITDSIHFFGLFNGILFLFSFPIWMDYAWLVIASYLIYRGVSVLKTKFYSAFLISISTILAFYGVYVILNIFWWQIKITGR